MFIILDADRRLADRKLKPAPLNLVYLLRKLEVMLMPDSAETTGLRWALVFRLRRMRNRLEKKQGYGNGSPAI